MKEQFSDPLKNNPDLKRKGYEADIKEINKKEQSVTAYVSTITKDSFNEVVLPVFDFTRFQKNPVVPWGHDYHIPPIGRSLWQKADRTGLIAKTQFFTKNQFGMDIWNMFSEGFLKAFSIGYQPTKKASPGDEEFDRLLEEWEFDPSAKEVHSQNNLLEYSAVTLPANPDAIVNILKAGVVKSDSLKSYFEDYLKENSADENLSSQKGERLAALLNRLIDGLVTEERSRSDIIEAMASAARISPDTVNGILSGEINCPPLIRLRGFARVLETSLARLRSAAESDGCDYENNNELIIDELKRINDRLNSLELSVEEKIALFEEAGTIGKQIIKNNPEVTVGFDEAKRRLARIVDGVTREITGKVS